MFKILFELFDVCARCFIKSVGTRTKQAIISPTEAHNALLNGAKKTKYILILIILIFFKLTIFIKKLF